ncbi:RNaseH domain-containing protein [Streptosporangium sp. NPDC051022]|uniref:RNaseH domain-containing protein n=1 Tax=Streptosporangium sp. NPDC051022 TaxID=3155752 RepID=UPI00341BD269
MMTTTAFRLPPDLLGEVWVYPLAPALGVALEELNSRWRRNGRNSEHARAPHASLATALSAVTGQPVIILPDPRTGVDGPWLITTAPIEPSVLNVATGVWERLARGGQDANVLAPLLKAVVPQRLSVGGDVDLSTPGRVVASNWVYRVLGWTVAEQLASQPVDVDGRKVDFRLDTRGDLVAWDDVITLPLRNGTVARGIIKISLGIKTLPGVGDLVCVPQVSLTRLVDDLRSVKHAWIEHGRSTSGSALLRLPVSARKVDGEWEHFFQDYSGAIVEECGLTPLPWSETVLTERPNLVRAGRSVNWSHPLGTGVGTRTYLRLMNHVTKVFDIEPVTYRPTKIKVQHDDAIGRERISPDSLDTAISSAGFERLRVVHLSAKPATRERIREEVEQYGQEDTCLLPDVGVAQRLTRRAEFASYDVAPLLQHGWIDRSGLLTAAPLLAADAGTLVLAVVDTEYENGSVLPDDAKPALRQALAKIGVNSQFIAFPPGSDGTLPAPRQPAPDAEPAERTDYSVVAAVRDLLRAGGLTDGRLTRAVALTPFPMDRDAWLVGVHVRIQNTSRKANGTNGRPLMVSVLVAARACTDPLQPWDLRIYVPGQGWLRHAAGLSAFHAGSIGTPIVNRQQSYAELRGFVDSALSELPGNDPVVVMIDAEATRRVWSGLTDTRLGEGTLPGDSLPTSRDIAVVRVGTEDAAVPRPVNHTDGRQPGKDPGKPASPRNRLYELVGDDGTRSWILGQASRTFNSGSKGRVGADFTRFTLPANRQREQGNNWHAFTGTEFVVVRPGVLGEDTVVALTARLCAQPLSWDNRTRRPTPLHMADTADRTHPGYRTEQQDDSASE